ncbi:hypothetical protein DM01DRAFT_1405714 [Hesseltinella vesiculosa]|uniref:Secreted protein n=1 Tax=Hesseltinella vesiculosa TaxID=101127 RepID=A0A1X2GNR1_9FUNG|nr:hypothetical protein DM01DRAFT_1405714 [Hesseltinella vesiculosa]
MLSLCILLLCFVPLAWQQKILVQHPSPNEKVIANSVVPVEYHVQRLDHFQPSSSISVVLQWQHLGSDQTLHANVHHGLTARAHRALEDLYFYHWRTPHCHFFLRYPPTQFNFSMVFTPANTTEASIVDIPLDFSSVVANTCHGQHH